MLYPALAVAIVLIALFGAPAQATTERVALVVGNGNYSRAAPLANPANDARELSKVLRAIGFTVLERTNLDRASMDKSLQLFLTLASDARVALLFYAGHGMQVSGRNYLVPVDAKFESPSALLTEVIDVEPFAATFAATNRASIIILDACRDNPFIAKYNEVLGTARSLRPQRGLARYSPDGPTTSASGTGMLIAFATAPGSVSLDGGGPNSPFTSALLRHITTPGLELRQMLTRVRADVAASTGNRQVPWDSSSLFGDVYLSGTVAPGVDGEALKPLSATSRKPKDCFAFNGQEFCE